MVMEAIELVMMGVKAIELVMVMEAIELAMVMELRY